MQRRNVAIGASSDSSKGDSKKMKKQTKTDIEEDDGDDKKKTKKNSTIISKTQLDTALEIEIACIYDIESVMEKYMVQHYKSIKKRFVFFSPEEKINKSMLIIEQIFILICKCKIITSIWRSIEMQKENANSISEKKPKEKNHYEKTALDFPFIKYYKLVSSVVLLHHIFLLTFIFYILYDTTA